MEGNLSPKRRVTWEFVIGLVDRYAGWREHARQMRDLRRMSDRDLKDIGLSRADAEREALKPYWFGTRK